MAMRQAAALLTPRSANQAATDLHACVEGAGLPGLACAAAAAAAAAGSRVEVLDERPALTARPTPVNVLPNLLCDLVALGVAADCVKAGFLVRVGECPRARQVDELVTQAGRSQRRPTEAPDQRALFLRRSRLVAAPA